jgi:hypothetical protein
MKIPVAVFAAVLILCVAAVCDDDPIAGKVYRICSKAAAVTSECADKPPKPLYFA